MKTARRVLLVVGVAVFVAGLLLPEHPVMPVLGAKTGDWNPDSFWHPRWGISGVHKGVDIFAKRGTPVLSAVPGFVWFTGTVGLGGNVVAVIGPKWHVHYYAHLEEIRTGIGRFVAKGEILGTVGTTGNAAGKPPHLHYAIITPIPYPWRADRGVQGWKKIFFLNPLDYVTPHDPSAVPRRPAEVSLSAAQSPGLRRRRAFDRAGREDNASRLALERRAPSTAGSAAGRCGT